MPGLPAELSSFVGRRRELAAIRRALSGTRLLTLTGPGGVGKSRLALRLAREHEDGAQMVELASLTEPSLVPVAVARGLGLGDEKGADPIAQVTGHLGDGPMLLIIDNCEHLLIAAAGLVGRLLDDCPGLAVVATSRAPLGLAAEAVYPVPPLSLPVGDLPSEAVDLFVERARASQPSFTLGPDTIEPAVRLCRALDGVPLAIELAAVQMRVLGVADLADRLAGRLDLPLPAEHGRPARQQSLRAAIDWSHELLAEPERVLWRRLSVFPGSFSPEAAAQVCDVGRPALGELVERSIVVRAEARFVLLETMRQYGRERLSASGEEEAWLGRHTDWCGELAAGAASRWWGPDQGRVLGELEVEHENVRAALAHCQRHPERVAAGLAIAADTWFFWHAQRHMGEGCGWLRGLLALAPAPSPTRVSALVALGTLLLLSGDAAGAQPVLEEAVAVARAQGAYDGLALALARLGSIVGARRDMPRAVALVDDAVTLARRLRRPDVLATVLGPAARITLGSGRVAEAASMYRECAELCAEAGERWQRLRALLPLGVALSDQGQHREAESQIREALALAYELGDERMVAWSVEGLAWARAEAGEAAGAARLLGAASTLHLRAPGTGYASDRARTDRCRTTALTALGEPAFERAFAEGAALDDQGLIGLALSGPRTIPDAALSAREREIAGLVAEGLSNREIAARLDISVRTAENHVNRALAKLGLRGRTQLGNWARNLGPG